jgi:hypothetical protein
VVGLPGETIDLLEGDLVVEGRAVLKGPRLLAEIGSDLGPAGQGDAVWSAAPAVVLDDAAFAPGEVSRLLLPVRDGGFAAEVLVSDAAIRAGEVHARATAGPLTVVWRLRAAGRYAVVAGRLDGQAVAAAWPVVASSGPGARERQCLPAAAPESWDVSEFAGRNAILRIVDDAKGGWGHLNVDHLVQTDTRPPGLATTVKRNHTPRRRSLHIPTQTGAPKRIVTLFVDGTQEVRNDVELATGKPDWWAVMDVSAWKGRKLTLKRVRCGGTDFKAACDHAHANRDKYDGYIIITDGGCYDPGPALIKRCWVLVPGTELMFPASSNDVVVKMKAPLARDK